MKLKALAALMGLSILGFVASPVSFAHSKAELDAGAACESAATVCPPNYACVRSDAGAASTSTCAPEGNAAGAACANDVGAAQCNGDYGLACVKGACASITYAAAGSACGPVDGGAAIRCSGSGTCTNGACVAAAMEGAACDTANGPACLPQAKCVVSDGGTGGTCVSLGNTGCTP